MRCRDTHTLTAPPSPPTTLAAAGALLSKLWSLQHLAVGAGHTDSNAKELLSCLEGLERVDPGRSAYYAEVRESKALGARMRKVMSCENSVLRARKSPLFSSENFGRKNEDGNVV